MCCKISNAYLRPIEITIVTYYGCVKTSEIKTGYFLGWAYGGNTEEGLETNAICELQDGTVLEVYPTYIKFLDRGEVLTNE